MVDDKRQGGIESPAAYQGEEFARRRKIIKTLSTVPVIVTVSCGAAMAQASVFQCVDATQGAIPAECGAMGDGWVRAENEVKCTDANGDYIKDANGDKVKGHKLLYATNQGSITTNPAGGNPFTVSCHASFT